MKTLVLIALLHFTFSVDTVSAADETTRQSHSVESLQNPSLSIMKSGEGSGYSKFLVDKKYKDAKVLKAKETQPHLTNQDSYLEFQKTKPVYPYTPQTQKNSGFFQDPRLHHPFNQDPRLQGGHIRPSH